MFFESLTGVDFFSHPWYRNTIYYMLYTWPPNSVSDCFGDGGERKGLIPLSRLAFADVLGKRFNDPCAAWYVDKSLEAMKTGLENDSSLRWHRLRDGTGNTVDCGTKNFDLTQAQLFGDIGIVAMHTNLADTTNNLMLAFRSSPYGSFNHAHADQNAFNVIFGGKRLFSNTGYYISYGDAHFKGWYKHSRGHNTVLIDGRGQGVDTTEAYGTVRRYSHGRRITYCMGDASNAYGDAGLTCFRRHLVLLRPSTVVIYDELEADHPAEWSWLLHSPNIISTDASSTHLTASNENGRARVDVLGSVPLNFEIDNRFDPPALNWRKRTSDGKLIEYPDQWHVTVSPANKASKMRYLAVMQIRNAADAETFDEPARPGDGSIRIGPWSISGELDTSAPAALEIQHQNGETALAVDKPYVNVGGKRHGSGDKGGGVLVERWPDRSIVEQAAGGDGTFEPIKLYPDNPHYFQWRGRPTILITSGEHYGAVLNGDFDYEKYLDTLGAYRFNLTRVFSGAYCEPAGAFNIRNNTLAPAPGGLLCPWARSNIPGYANGGNKFDLTKWDRAYFARLREFVADAGRRGVVVEFVMFSPFYDDSMWKLSPLNAANNINGVGRIRRHDVFTMKDRKLTAVQKAMVRKIVEELNGFDNLYYEICNEPYERGGQTEAWQEHIAEVITETEAGLPNKHLIAQNLPWRKQNLPRGSSGRVMPINRASVLNFHGASPP
ncbi:MAG: heparinase II/III family protein, partial [Planctomycetota bacterium]